LNYRIGISDRLFTIDYANLGHHLTLPNGIDAGVPVWNYCGQRKALIISRLQKDKFMRLCAAIEFCATRNIPFEIAGMPENSSTTKRLKRRYTLRPDVVAPGAINTKEFLKKNADRYLNLLQESGKFFSKPVLRAFHVCSHRIKEPNIPHS